MEKRYPSVIRRWLKTFNTSLNVLHNLDLGTFSLNVLHNIMTLGNFLFECSSQPWVTFSECSSQVNLGELSL